LPKENFHLPEEEQQHVFNAFSDSEARMEFTSDKSTMQLFFLETVS
jgi:hypothetical protein